MKLEEAIVDYLLDNKLKISVAESCTGGQLGATLVNVAGVSGCFEEGYVTYSDDVKHKNLGVRQDILSSIGAVSAQVACEMAAGVRRKAKADIGLATTGFAGPAGGTSEIPVGRVYIACSIGNITITRKYTIKGSRKKVRDKAVQFALKLLWDCLMDEDKL